MRVSLNDVGNRDIHRRDHVEELAVSVCLARLAGHD